MGQRKLKHARRPPTRAHNPSGSDTGAASILPTTHNSTFTSVPQIAPVTYTLDLAASANQPSSSAEAHTHAAKESYSMPSDATPYPTPHETPSLAISSISPSTTQIRPQVLPAMTTTTLAANAALTQPVSSSMATSTPPLPNTSTNQPTYAAKLNAQNSPSISSTLHVTYNIPPPSAYTNGHAATFATRADLDEPTVVAALRSCGLWTPQQPISSLYLDKFRKVWVVGFGSQTTCYAACACHSTSTERLAHLHRTPTQG